jgi:protein-S-isoprenylcysteine O-methyltransferase Ste14
MWNILFIIITAAWILELIIHRPDSKSKTANQSEPVERLSLILIWISLVSTITIAAMSSHFQFYIWSSDITLAIGLICYASGVMLRWWGIQTLGHHFSRHIKFESNHTLISNGPYHLLAHPLYFAILLCLHGICLFLSSFIGLIIVWLLVFPAILYRMKLEERAMMNQFGESYASWLRKRWRIIPFLY